MNKQLEEYRKEREGMTSYNKQGMKMKLKKYYNANKCLIEFEDGTEVTSCYKNFIENSIFNPNFTKIDKMKNERLGLEKKNNQGLNMKIISYINAQKITVQFEDKTIVNTDFRSFKEGWTRHPQQRKNKQISTSKIGEININNKGYEMKIIEYNTFEDVWVQFNDEYHAKVHTSYHNFRNGGVKNPYAVGEYGEIIGDKYPVYHGKKITKEYSIWRAIINRACSKKYEYINNSTYKDVSICEEWLYYPNFYEWLHSQENYDKWKNGRYDVEKDLLSNPNNKIYSPETCFIVPHYINALLIRWDKGKKKKNNLPIGISQYKDKYYVGKLVKGSKYYNTIEEAYEVYKKLKRKTIIDTVSKAYSKGDITEQCYKAFLNYDYFAKDK